MSSISHAEFRVRQKLVSLPNFRLGMPCVGEEVLRSFQDDVIGAYVNSGDPLDAVLIGQKSIWHAASGKPVIHAWYADLRAVRSVDGRVVCVLADASEREFPIPGRHGKFLDATSVEMFLKNMMGAVRCGLL